MRGLPHSNDLEEAVKGELWAGVTPSGRSPVTWIPVKGVLRAVKPRVEGLISSNIKPNETRTPRLISSQGVLLEVLSGAMSLCLKKKTLSRAMNQHWLLLRS